MFPQAVVRNNKGKAQEGMVQASGSSPSTQGVPENQKSGVVRPVSPLDLSATRFLQHRTNGHISQWLDDTDILSAAEIIPPDNNENVRASSDPGASMPDELRKELDALAKRPFNMQSKSGTDAPANTPQPCDNNGSRPRAHSEGKANGSKLQMGTQVKTIDASVMPMPLFSASNSSTPVRPSVSMPQHAQASTAAEILQNHAPQLPGRAARLSLTPDLGPQPDNVGKERISLAPVKTTNLDASFSTGTPVLDGIAGKGLGLVKPPPDLSQDVGQSATQRLVDSTVGRPPSPPFVRQSTQHDPLPATNLSDVLTETISVDRSFTIQPFNDFSYIGRQHSRSASTMRWEERPKTRGKRILQDLRQLFKDCCFRKMVEEVLVIGVSKRPIKKSHSPTVNEHQDASQARDIFEPTEDNAAKSCLPSLDGQLIKGESSMPEGQARSDAALRQIERTLSGGSSNTTQGTNKTSDPPTNAPASSKSFLRKWRAKRATKAREKAAKRCTEEQQAGNPVMDATYPELLAAVGIIP